MIRASLRFVPRKDRKVVDSWLKDIYQADTEAAAEDAMDTFELEWGGRYPMTVQCWRSAWARVIPFLSFPDEIRRTLYTTNAIESMNYQAKKVTKSREHFPNDEAVFKLAYLALRDAAAKWTRPVMNWPQALQQFALHFDGRIPARLD